MANVVQIVIKAFDQTKAGLTTPIKNLKDLQSSVSKLGPFFAGAATAAVSAMAVITKSAIDTADETGKTAQKVGLTTESYSTLRHVAEMASISNEGFITSLRQLSKSAIEAAAGAKEPAEAYRLLGIEVRNIDGTLKGNEALLLEVADRFQGLEDGAAKTALAMKVFGKSGADMIPMLNGGADAIRSAQQEARDLGLEISGKTAAAADEFNSNIDRLKKSVAGLANTIVAPMVPALVDLSDKLVAVAKSDGGFKNLLDILSKISAVVVYLPKNVLASANVLATVMAAAVASLAKAITLVGEAIKIVFNLLNDLGAAFDHFLVGNLSQIPPITKSALARAGKDFEAFTELVKANANETKHNFGEVGKAIREAFLQVTGQTDPLKVAEAAMSAATPNWKGLQKPGSIDIAGGPTDATKRLAEIEKAFNQTTRSRLQNLFIERTEALKNIDELGLGEKQLADAKRKIFETYDKKIADERQKINEDELKQRQDMARELQRAADLGAEIQLSTLTGAAAVLAQEEQNHKRRLQQIEELAVAEQEKLKLIEQAHQSHEQRKTQLRQEAEDVRAELDAAYRAGDVQRAIVALQAEQGARLADMESRRSMIDSYVENWRVAHSTITSFAAQSVSVIRDGLSSAITNVIMGAQKASEAFAALGKQIVSMVVNYIVQRGIAFALDKAFAAAGLVFLKTAVTANVAAASALAGAWGAAATAAAIATLGTATLAGKAVPVMMAANAAIGSGIAVAAGAVGGIAHGGMEFVPAETTYRVTRGERILSPKQNTDLTNYLDNQQPGVGGNQMVHVTITLDGKVFWDGIKQASRNGELEIHARAIV